MPKVGFYANMGNRLELRGCDIKKVDFIPEQEFASIENTTTILDPDGITVRGIQQSFTKTVTVKLTPFKKGADENNATIKGQKEYRQKYKDRDETRKVKETSDSDSTQCGGKVEKEEAKKKEI